MTTSAKGQGARRSLAASAASKLGQRAGFTLSELLTTVIIVGLVTSLVAGGATLATNHFSRSVALSESFMLYSTLEQVLDNELSFTETIYGAKIGESNTYEVDGFQSWNYLFIDAPASAGEGGGEGAGAGSSVGTYYLMMVGPDGKGQDASVSSAFGQLAFCAQDGSSPNKILSPSSYNNNLVARVDTLVYDAASRLFTVRLLIAQAGDTGNPLVDETFTVRALNIIHLDGTAITLPPTTDDDDDDDPEPETPGVWRDPDSARDNLAEAKPVDVVGTNGAVINGGLEKGSTIVFTYSGEGTPPARIAIKLFLCPSKNSGTVKKVITVVLIDGIAEVTLPNDGPNNSALKMKIAIDQEDVGENAITATLK